MTIIQSKIELLCRLGQYMLSGEESWLEIQDRAVQSNQWFTLEHVRIAAKNIAHTFLQQEALTEWMSHYQAVTAPKKVGIVTAGNIPLVGFHDFICGFMSGNEVYLKLSSKDAVLLTHLIAKMKEWAPELTTGIHIAEILKNCEAFIATGSNNSARYFEQYFQKFPHIIRRNRTSVAVLDGTETVEELQGLARDVFLYFGLGCRNVTQVCVPEGYDFTQLLSIFERYDSFMDHNKYHNNYDYYLAIYLLNRVPYLNNGSLLMVENEQPFSAVSVLHYRFYKDQQEMLANFRANDDIQAVIGHQGIAFGAAQTPSLMDYADGVDAMVFLCNL